MAFRPAPKTNTPDLACRVRHVNKKEAIRSILAERLKTAVPVHSRKGPSLPHNQAIRWLPLVKCGTEERTLGVTVDGQWVVEVSEGLQILDEGSKFILVIVLLERPLHVVAGEFHDGLIKHFGEFDKDDAYTLFPVTEIIRAGLKSESEYWVVLSLDWYESLAFEDRSGFENDLLKIMETKKISQKTRHRAKHAYFNR